MRTLTVEKTMRVRGRLIAFFDGNVSGLNGAELKSERGRLRIEAAENGRSVSFSAIVSTDIPERELTGMRFRVT